VSARGPVAAGGALVLAILALLGVHARWVAHNWDAVRRVTVPAGQPGPAFSLPLLDGGRLTDGNLRGQPSALAFWATWCEPCRAELPVLDRLAREGLRIYAIDIEGPERREAVAAFARSAHLTLPVAYGGNQVADQYRVETIPHLVVLDGQGRVREVVQGPDALARALRAAEHQ
jgi:thiol-disulfide isomerase/thioredoxin